MTKIILYLLGLYFVPFGYERNFGVFNLAHPLSDKVYLFHIPLYQRDHPLRYWNYQDFSHEPSTLQTSVSFFDSTLLSPSVLLYSERFSDSSDVGFSLKSPIFKKENQIFLWYSNVKGGQESNYNVLGSILLKSPICLEASLGNLGGKGVFSLYGGYGNFNASLGVGDFSFFTIGAKFKGKILAEFRREGNLNTLLFSTSHFSFGLDYTHHELSPHAEFRFDLPYGKFYTSYGCFNFASKLEKRLYSSLLFNYKGLSTGFYFKIGREGVYHFDGDSLSSGKYVFVPVLGFSSRPFKFWVWYSYPKSQIYVYQDLSLPFGFKKGELILEPGGFVTYNKLREKFEGKAYLSLFLFKALELRVSYGSKEGLGFSAGVNLLD